MTETNQKQHPIAFQSFANEKPIEFQISANEKPIFELAAKEVDVTIRFCDNFNLYLTNPDESGYWAPLLRGNIWCICFAQDLTLFWEKVRSLRNSTLPSIPEGNIQGV